MILLTTLLAVLAAGARGASWGGYQHQDKCERLNVSFCRGLRYNLTAMPNFMGHETQLQAERGVSADEFFFNSFFFILSSLLALFYVSSFLIFGAGPFCIVMRSGILGKLPRWSGAGRSFENLYYSTEIGLGMMRAPMLDFVRGFFKI